MDLSSTDTFLERQSTTTTTNECKITSGFVTVAQNVQLYYEIRSPQVTRETSKMILIMGAFATLKHFDEQALFLVEHFAHSSTPIEILTYDHRGIGKSVPSPKVRQTSRMLADDALSLINQVWGTDAIVHVHGASLGGMVAQELALLLIPSHRLRSLYLAVTSRGSSIRPMAAFGPGIWSLIMPFVIKKDREQMVRNVLLPATFSPATLKVSGEKYATLWIRDYDQWWAFGNSEACASQCSVAASHYLTDQEAELIRTANIPITVQIASKDKLMPPNKQEQLAKLLNAKTVVFDQGHMGDDDVKKEIFRTAIVHLENAI